MPKPRLLVIACLLFALSAISTKAQRISTVAGGIFDGGQALDAQLHEPFALAIDGDGNLYVSEDGSAIIRKINAATGVINIFAGSQVLGDAGDGGLATSARLHSAASIAIHPITGEIYFVDRTFANIRKVNPSTGIITRYAGSGHNGFSADGGSALNAVFSNPHGIAFATNGDLYVSTNARIRKINGATGIVTTIAGTGTAGWSGDDGPAIDATLKFPTYMAFDEDNNLFFADDGNFTIRRIDAISGIITHVAGTGTAGYSGDDGPAVDAKITNVGGIAVRNDQLWFSDNNNGRIRHIDLNSGEITTIAGTGVNGFNGDGVDPLLAKINLPRGIVVKSNGDIIFSDYFNRRIRKISGGVITTIAGHGTFSGDGGQASNASLFTPLDVAFDNAGSLYIADAGNYRVRKVDGSSVITTVVGNGTWSQDYPSEGQNALTVPLSGPRAVQVYNGALYFAHRCKILKVDLTTGNVTTAVGSGTCGFGGDGDQANGASSQINSPQDLVIDANGIMYIADTWNSRIRKVNLSTGVIETIAGTGATAFSGDGNLAINAELNQPYGVALDASASHLYIADQWNARVRKLNLQTGVITTVAGGGAGGGIPALATAVNIAFPKSVVSLTNGDLLIHGGTSIIVLDANDGMLRHWVGSDGQGFSGDGGPSQSAHIKFDGGMAVSPLTGDMYFTDQGTNRVRKVTQPSPQTITFDDLADALPIGHADVALIASSSSGLPILFQSTNPSVAAIINGSTLRINAQGAATIKATQTGNADFARAAEVSQPLTITKAPQTITFNAPPNATYGQPAPNLVATASSNLAVSFSSSDPLVAAVSGNVVTVVGVGSTTITASQAGNSIYFAAPDVTRTLTVDKAQPSLVMTSPFGGVDGTVINLTAKSSSGGSISFNLTNGNGVATLAGNQLTMIGTGTATLEVSVASDANFEAATIQVPVLVAKPRPVIEFTSAPSGKAGTTLPLSINPGGSTGSITYQITNITGSASVSGTTLALNTPGIIRVRAVLAEEPNFMGGFADQMIRIFPLTAPNGDGRVFGTTTEGGTNNAGVFYSVGADGSGYHVHHDFASAGGGPNLCNLIEASNGKIYGVTNNGGLFNSGTLFEYETVNGTYVKLFDFSPADGTYPYGGVIEASNGKLYGATFLGGANNLGVLFEFDLSTSTYTKKADFSTATGGSSYGGLTEINGKLYGCTVNQIDGVSQFAGGKLFKYDLATESLTIVYDLSTNQALGTVVFGRLTRATNGKYYGVTSNGTASVFEFDPVSEAVVKRATLDYNMGIAVLGSFVTAPNGKMYALAAFGGAAFNGSILEFDPTTFGLAARHSFSGGTGEVPYGSLTLAPNGKMYGYAQTRGNNNGGTLYEFNPSDFSFSKKFDFGGDNGTSPMGQMVSSYNGKLYGTSVAFGVNGHGSLFSFDPSSNAFEKKFDFKGSVSGASPFGGLAKVQGDNLLGIATGGDAGFGVVYELDPGNNMYTKRLDFVSVPARVGGGLMRASNGKFYGTTIFGGTSNQGVLYEFDQVTGSVTTKANFNNRPQGQLTEALDGKLYGVTQVGGSNNVGTLFTYDPSAETMTIKHNFANANGSHPATRLALAANGKLYGTTSFVGTNGQGVLFSYDPGAGTYEVQMEFDITFGEVGEIVLGPAGKLYFTVGRQLDGRLVEFDPVTKSHQDEFSFSLATGSKPLGRTVKVGDKLVGATRFGGNNGLGVVYSYDPVANIYSVLHHLDRADGAIPTGYLQSAVGESQEITFDALPAKTFLDEPFVITASASSKLPVVFTSSDASIATVAGATVTIHNAGSVSLTASQGGNEFFEAESVTRELIVNKAAQTISFNALEAKTVGSPPFELNATSSSTLLVTFTSDNLDVATISGDIVTIVGAGTASITAHQAGNNNFEPSAVSQQLLVTKHSQTITFGELAPKTFGDPAFNLEATSSSGLEVAYSSSNTLVASVSGNVITIHAAGPVTITASQAGSNLYEPATPVVRELVVAKKSQTITLSLPESMTFNDNDVTLAASATSGLAIVYSVDNTAVAVIENGKLKIVGTGSVVVTASQAGDGNYLPASAARTVVVGKSGQGITFATISDRTLGDAPITLNATASSGLPVSYSSSSDKVTINGSTVTLIKAGRPTILANQAGNSNYLAATTAQRIFCINPAKPVITVGSGENPVLTSSNNDGNVWMRGGTAINGATGKTFTPSEAGTYTVRTTVDDCSSATSEPVSIIVTGLEEETSTGLNVYPNPVVSDVFVELLSHDRADVVFEMFDALGRRVSTTDGTTNTLTHISMEESSPGIYLLKVSLEGKIHTSRIVKQ